MNADTLPYAVWLGSDVTMLMRKPDLMDEYARRWPSTEFKPESEVRQNAPCLRFAVLAQVRAKGPAKLKRLVSDRLRRHGRRY